MTETQKSNKKILLGVGIVAALAILLGVLYFVFVPKAAEGTKAITIEVIDNEQKSTVYELNTDAQYLREAMDEAADKGFTYSGSESEYGIMLESINGVTADYNADGAYWSIFVNGEYGNYGADTQVVTDRDAFQFVYTVYTE